MRFIAFLVLICLCASAALSARAEATPAPPRKVVYLTFDDAPSELTPELLRALEAEGVKATFFLVGRAIEQHPENARAIHEAGHALACHSYHHARKHLTDDVRFYQEMKRFKKAVREAFHRPMFIRVFRYPYGSNWVPEEGKKAAMDFGYLWIDWNAHNGDADYATGTDIDKMLDTAISTSGKQDEIVILMHDNKSRTIEMLPALIRHYRDAGYVFDVLTPELDHLIENVHMGLPDGRMQ